MKESVWKKNKIKKITNTIINIIIFIEITLVIIFLGPSLFGLKTFVVTSGSMEPLYPTGSLIYVKKVDPNHIKENDVITFYMQNSKIIATHQVYEIDNENKTFKTQGINNKDEEGNIIHDAPINFSSLIGKPVVCIKYLGYINRLITTPPGVYFVIVFTIFITLIYYTLDKRKDTEVN